MQTEGRDTILLTKTQFEWMAVESTKREFLSNQIWRRIRPIKSKKGFITAYTVYIYDIKECFYSLRSHI